MRGKTLTLALLLVICTSISIEMGFASPEETTVLYTVITGDIFPAMTDIDVSVTAVGYVKFTCSDGTVLPNSSTKYSIAPNAESLNSPLKKVSGSPTIQFQIPVIPEFPSTVILLLTIVFATFAVIIGKKRFPSPE